MLYLNDMAKLWLNRFKYTLHSYKKGDRYHEGNVYFISYYFKNAKQYELAYILVEKLRIEK